MSLLETFIQSGVLKDIRLGDSQSETMAKVGKPEFQETWSTGGEMIRTDEIEVHFRDGKVEWLEVLVWKPGFEADLFGEEVHAEIALPEFVNVLSQNSIPWVVLQKLCLDTQVAIEIQDSGVIAIFDLFVEEFEKLYLQDLSTQKEEESNSELLLKTKGVSII